ncbi:hypothetical protein GBA52_010064 [Prunus armeniaca]|nr:hypothetical protein GBA52_010064 [Prunus armeniaca]
MARLGSRGYNAGSGHVAFSLFGALALDPLQMQTRTKTKNCRGASIAGTAAVVAAAMETG